MSIVIGTLGIHVFVEADAQAFRLRTEGAWDLAQISAWPPDATEDALGAQVAMEVESLLERGLAEASRGQIEVPWSTWADLILLGLEVPRHWLSWSPFLLQIDSTSSLGRDDFQYEYRYMLGTREVGIERWGAVVRRAHHPGLYLLDPQTLALVEAMDGFNALSPEARCGEDAWLRFGEVKGCAQAVGAQLDEYLKSNDVIVPSKIGLTVVEQKDGSLRFLPRCSGVPKEAMERAFLRSREDQALFHVDGEEGRRFRVVMRAPMREILSEMRKVQNVTGQRAERLRRQPDLAFEGLLDRMEVTYARRVEGVGDFKPLSVPRTGASGAFLDVEGIELGAGWGEDLPSEDLPDPVYKVPATVEARDETSGNQVRVQIQTQPDARAFVGAMESAQAKGEPTFEYRGYTFAVEPGLKDCLQTGQSLTTSPSGKKFLLIYTDEEEVKPEDVLEAEAATGEGLQDQVAVYEAPSALRPEYPLKPHQEEAVAWLQRCSRLVPKRRGVLLADEMGLGKTLEVLTFAAWVIEHGLFEGLKGPGPYRPILVVAPLMLVENETWQSDMAKFFQPGFFGSVLTLHGPNLQALRMARGKETDLGKPMLDLETLCQHRVVITNYETVTNFQHSLAQVRNGKSIWSMVVTDEAQEFKNPQSRISHAIKALHPDFHIASTGTPVENKLLDLWNLFDALQPSLLGSAREFKQRYEAVVEAGDGEHALGDLREQLHYHRPHAFLLRREKTILPGFPKKEEHTIPCAMSHAEVERHVRLLRALKHADTRKGLHLGYLHRLVELYQHPLAHREDFEQLPVSELLGASSKLQGVMRRLHDIRERGEKVLVFARHIKIQRMLARVIGETFGLHVSIINGETGRSGAKEAAADGRGRQYRAALLRRFKEQEGFHALVLSPFVAGVGLTITEANHVIHFGRWWNPAVESQATDRVYRIGQTKDVRVHLPILKDETGTLPASFDERLHALLERKRALARDFLTPMEDEQSLASQLCMELSGELPKDRERGSMAMTPEELSGLPMDLFEAYVALLLEQNGYAVQLTHPKHNGGVSMLATQGQKTNLIRVADPSSGAEAKVEAALLQAIQWTGHQVSKTLLLRRTGMSGEALDTGKGGPLQVWTPKDYLALQRNPIDELEVLDRHQERLNLKLS